MLAGMFPLIRAHAFHIGLVIAGMVIVAVPAGAYIWHERAMQQAQLVAAAVVPIATTTPAQVVVKTATTSPTTVTTSVSFEGAGTIKSISVSSGKSVTSGDLLFTVSRTDLSTQLSDAKKTLATAQAALTKAASTTAPVSASDQDALTQAQNSVRTAVRNAYINSNDVVINKAAQFFTNANSASILLSFSIPNSQLAINLESSIQSLSPVFPAWEKQVYASSFNTATDTAALALTAETNLKPIPSFLNSLSTAIGEAITLSAAEKSSGESTVSNAQLTISNALSAVISAEAQEQAARAQIADDQKTENAALLQTDQAAVTAAQANVNAIEADITQTVKAPVAGVVTIKVKDGEAVSTSTVLATISMEK